MPRVKRGVTAHRRHKALLQLAEGKRGTRNRLFKVAHEAVMHALQYQYRDRRTRKRTMRALWIARINAAARIHGISYSQLIHGLDIAQVQVDRKVLADLAVRDDAIFADIVEKAKAALPA